MSVQQNISDRAVLVELGERICRYRLNRNITQVSFAREAGVSERTIHRIEHGQSIQLSNFIRILQAFGLLENLNLLVPAPPISPIQQAKMQGKQRKRASKSVVSPQSEEPWSWGDDE